MHMPPMRQRSWSIQLGLFTRFAPRQIAGILGPVPSRPHVRTLNQSSGYETMRPQPLAACLALVVFLPFGGASATPQATPAAPAPPAPRAPGAPTTPPHPPPTKAGGDPAKPKHLK
ncbi:hypothetical protein Q6A20_11830, partial [Xanthomonas euvesicatoria pv. eucalypti]|nr:hypothetical protein [Xanthomonas euvesicatoria pv. eucalypti]